MTLVNAYGRLFDDIMQELTYPEIISDSYYSYSNKESYLIEMPLVGIAKDELNIKVEGDFLKVETKPAKTSKFVKSSSIQFSLREDADIENISAKLENGLLLLTIPKTIPEKKSVNVKVN